MKCFSLFTLSIMILVVGAASRGQDTAAPPANSTATQPIPQLPGDGESELPPSGGRQKLAGQPLSDPYAPPMGDKPPGTKTSSPNYTASGNLILVVSEKRDAISGFSKSTGKWARQKLQPAATDKLSPTVGQNVAALQVGQTIYAFSGQLARWDALRLPAGIKPNWSVYADIVLVTAGKTVYTFANSTGNWTSPNADNTNATAAPKPAGKNVREVVESYLAAVLESRTVAAYELAVEGKTPTTKKTIKDLFGFLNEMKRRGLKRPSIVDVITGNKDRLALVVSSPVIIPTPDTEPPRTGQLVFYLRHATVGKWIIEKVEALTDEATRAQIAKFKQTDADVLAASRIVISLRMGEGTQRATLAATVRNLKEIKLRSTMRPVVEIVLDNQQPKGSIVATIKTTRNAPYQDTIKVIDFLKKNGIDKFTLGTLTLNEPIKPVAAERWKPEPAEGHPKPRNQRAVELAERYRWWWSQSNRNVGRKERSELKRQLRNNVAAEFQARQERQRAELSQLQRRLRKIQQLIETRVRMKEEIIDHRVEELLNPALRWDAKTAQPARAGITLTRPAQLPGMIPSQPSGPPAPTASNIIGREPGESIYNDRLKRFKFRLEKIEVATAITAQAFYQKYNDGKNPQIVGVWGDPLTNSIIVIGPPEAEQPIRDALAQLEADWAGLATAQGASLEVQQKSLVRQRNELLAEIARIQLAVIDIEAAGANSGDKKKLDQLTVRYQSYAKELKALVLKLEVIRNTIYQQKQGNDLESDIGEDADKATRDQLALARERVKVVNAEFRVGNAAAVEVQTAMSDLAALELKAAKTPQDRLTARQQQIQLLEAIKTFTVASYKAGKVKRSDVLAVDAELLKAKAALAREFPPLEKTLKQPPAALEGDPKGVHAYSTVWDALGIDVKSVAANRLQSTPYRGGLEIITIPKGSRAMKAGMRLGDILVGIHVWEVASIDNLVWVLQQPQVRPSEDQSKKSKFYLVRGKETLFGTILLPAEKKANGKEGGGEAVGDEADKPPRLSVKATTGSRNVRRPSVP